MYGTFNRVYRVSTINITGTDVMYYVAIDICSTLEILKHFQLYLALLETPHSRTWNEPTL